MPFSAGEDFEIMKKLQLLFGSFCLECLCEDILVDLLVNAKKITVSLTYDSGSAVISLLYGNITKALSLNHTSLYLVLRIAPLHHLHHCDLFHVIKYLIEHFLRWLFQYPLWIFLLLNRLLDLIFGPVTYILPW